MQHLATWSLLESDCCFDPPVLQLWWCPNIPPLITKQHLKTGSGLKQSRSAKSGMWVSMNRLFSGLSQFLLRTLLWGIICRYIREELEPWLSWILTKLGWFVLSCRLLEGLCACSFRMTETRLWDQEEVLHRGEEKALVFKSNVALQSQSGKTKNTPSSRRALIGYHEEPVCMETFLSSSAE